ncbi:hypothetical protein GBAR_LOCUS585 [Geodia barretti]|uniref:Uncharacterized protein n=1 Tax=Geodia barretti TaxID=519541 RepID=A0AA35W106_GEOBA|nr:hypothetical protein GBAR_LOCUS585 [Geodia barretti]
MRERGKATPKLSEDVRVRTGQPTSTSNLTMSGECSAHE